MDHLESQILQKLDQAVHESEDSKQFLARAFWDLFGFEVRFELLDTGVLCGSFEGPFDDFGLDPDFIGYFLELHFFVLLWLDLEIRFGFFGLFGLFDFGVLGGK